MKVKSSLCVCVCVCVSVSVVCMCVWVCVGACVNKNVKQCKQLNEGLPPVTVMMDVGVWMWV